MTAKRKPAPLRSRSQRRADLIRWAELIDAARELQAAIRQAVRDGALDEEAAKKAVGSIAWGETELLEGMPGVSRHDG